MRRSPSQTRNIPRTRSNFGLSHRDLHGWNFFVDRGRITVIDFDDCGYDYFAHDIAMAVYYAADFMHRTVPASSVDEVSAARRTVSREFLKGYRRYYDLGIEDLSTIPLFAERRRLELTLLTYDLWSNEHARPDQKAWLERNLSDIKRNVPCLSACIVVDTALCICRRPGWSPNVQPSHPVASRSPSVQLCSLWVYSLRIVSSVVVSASPDRVIGG